MSEVDRAVRVRLDLLAEALHVDVERLRVAEVVGAPDLLDQEVPGEEPALPAQERLEELELLRRERDRLAPDADLVAATSISTGPPVEDVDRRSPADASRVRRRRARTRETSSRTENGFVT